MVFRIFAFKAEQTPYCATLQWVILAYLLLLIETFSSVKATGQQSNPASRRKSTLSDGVFVGLCLGGQPSQFIAFTKDGITIQDKNNNSIVMNESGTTITDANGNTVTMSSSGIRNAVKAGRKITQTAGGTPAIVETVNGPSTVELADS